MPQIGRRADLLNDHFVVFALAGLAVTKKQPVLFRHADHRIFGESLVFPSGTADAGGEPSRPHRRSSRPPSSGSDPAGARHRSLHPGRRVDIPPGSSSRTDLAGEQEWDRLNSVFSAEFGSQIASSSADIESVVDIG